MAFGSVDRSKIRAIVLEKLNRGSEEEGATDAGGADEALDAAFDALKDGDREAFKQAMRDYLDMCD
jgi:DNA-binding GntR family transcriptional regulator